MKKICSFICLIFIFVFISVCVIHSLPVKFDSGACAGGYETSIFDKYSKNLASSYYDEEAKKYDVTPIRGTHKCKWEDRYIYLEFDVEYNHPSYGIIKERLCFEGERVWIDTYKWNDGKAVSKAV